MYLLDTNVISELRRRQPHGAVLQWFRSVSTLQLHLSAVSVGEIQAGVEVTRAQDPAKAQEIESWLDDVVATFRVLPMDGDCFRTWARMMRGRSQTLMHDAMIAATAQIHSLTVVTRNASDFSALGVPFLDPFRFGNPA